MRRIAAIWVLAVAFGACGSDGDGGPAGRIPDGGGDIPASGCEAEGERMHEILPANHVASIAGLRYSSNPPSSGPHCQSAGAYGVYDATKGLPRCNWIHNLEHGAVVLLYNCPRGCPDTVAALADVMQQAARDPDCGARKRLILTPDADLDTTVAAAAWGYTWKAKCLDVEGKAALVKFIDAHLGSKGIAPEVAPGVCL